MSGVLKHETEDTTNRCTQEWKVEIHMMEGNETAFALLPHTCQLWLQQIQHHIFELSYLERSCEGLAFEVFFLYPTGVSRVFSQPGIWPTATSKSITMIKETSHTSTPPQISQGHTTINSSNNRLQLWQLLQSTSVATRKLVLLPDNTHTIHKKKAYLMAREAGEAATAAAAAMTAPPVHSQPAQTSKAAPPLRPVAKLAARTRAKKQPSSRRAAHASKILAMARQTAPSAGGVPSEWHPLRPNKRMSVNVTGEPGFKKQ